MGKKRGMPPFLGGVIFMAALGACSPNSDIAGFNLAPSAEAVARGYPALMPASFFNMAVTEPVDTNNLAARAAALHNKVRAFRGPVIQARDRARLEAALRRNFNRIQG